MVNAKFQNMCVFNGEGHTCAGGISAYVFVVRTQKLVTNTECIEIYGLQEGDEVYSQSSISFS